MIDRLSSDQWSVYWHKGTPTTFLGRFQNNYDGEIGAYWDKQFQNLPDNAAIVDLATGNGALAILAAKYSNANNRSFSIAAVDYADIDPGNLVFAKEPDSVTSLIKRYPQTPMENLTLADQSQDFAMSQFGFEYGDPTASVKQVSRVLKPQARFTAMMHSEKSVLLEQARDGLAQVTTCQNNTLHEMLKALLQRLDKLREESSDPADDETAENLRADINDVTLELHEAMENHSEPTQITYFLENSMAVFRAQFSGTSTEEKIALLDHVKEETESYRLRMSDLTTAARSGREVDSVEHLLTKEGFRVTNSEPFKLEGHLFAHLIEAERR